MATSGGKFIITREDLSVDPLTLTSEGLKIGRLPSCEIVLNHPTVSRLHAGINEADGQFQLFNFSHSSGTTLNGRLLRVEEAETLADGDVLRIGPFLLHVGRVDDALALTVTMQIAVNVAETDAREDKPQSSSETTASSRAIHRTGTTSDTLSVFWEKRKREAGTMQRLSALRPQAPARVVGKARFNWIPTRDLARPWPLSLFFWGALIVALLTLVATLRYAKAFSPAPLSAAHTRSTMLVAPAIATRVNADSCTTCHAPGTKMETSCASCHRTETFNASMTESHMNAGLTCINCHAEHRGAQFTPAAASINACTSCHNSDNHQLYRGKAVFTPHGGTFGYPVVDGKWVWRGLTQQEWEQKPPEMRDALLRMEETTRRWPASGDAADRDRSAQFHLLHLHRVKIVGSLKGNREGELSCSSCHQSFAPIDRATPRATCGACHNGDAGGQFKGLLANEKPNCISCHVQHVQDRQTWATTFLKSNAN